MKSACLCFFWSALWIGSIVPEAARAQTAAASQPPVSQPGTDLAIYSPKLHPLYDGHFILSGGRIFQVGTLNDPPGWDHIDNEAKAVRAVPGSLEIDLDEIKNTGSVVAHLKISEGDLTLTFDRFHPFSPCHDGGVASFIFEHGDSGCGDSNWPKTLIYLAGWGTGHATLNAKPLYDNYEMHFMVTQGMRDRKTLKTRYPALTEHSHAGQVDPAAQQIDFYIRSPETDPRNSPTRKVFDHFFAMEVTWK